MFDLDLSLREKAEMAHLNKQMSESERLQNEEDEIIAMAFDVLAEKLDMEHDQIAELPWERKIYIYSSVDHVRMEFIIEDMRFTLRRWPLDADDLELKVGFGGANPIEIKNLADLGAKIAANDAPRRSTGKPK